MGLTIQMLKDLKKRVEVGPMEQTIPRGLYLQLLEELLLGMKNHTLHEQTLLEIQTKVNQTLSRKDTPDETT